MIELKNVCVEFEMSDFGIKDINIKIDQGEIVAIIGSSGAGKSTLLRTINMLHRPSSGEVIFKGLSLTSGQVNLNEVRKKMGMVFQNYTLFEHLNVLENLIIGPQKLLKLSISEATERAVTILKQIGLLHKAKSYSDELSNGQKQRIAIARSLSMNPEIMLFDEPVSNLDPNAVGEVVEVMKELTKQGIAMILVTHDMQIVQSLAQRVIFMSDGRIVEQGTTDQIFNNPQMQLTKDFISEAQCFIYSIEDEDYDYIELLNASNNYAIKNNLSTEAVEKMRHIVEEIVLLVPKTTGTKLKILADSKTAELTISVLYHGVENNVLSSDSIEAKIISRLSKSIEHSFTADEVNQIKVVI
jgi:polar amino acid transport system ATP-binding protein